MALFTTVIIEDNQADAQILTNALTTHFPHIHVAAICQNLHTAETQILTHNPQLIFLDINLGNQNGFDLLENIKHLHLHVIVVTAHNENLLRALRASATDYLQKPYPTNELITVVNNTLQKIAEQPANTRVATQANRLLQFIDYPFLTNQKIILPASEGQHLIPLNQIIYLTATGSKGNQTEVHLTTHQQNIILAKSKTVIVSINLGSFESILSAHNFIRVNRSTVINLYHINLYNAQSKFLVLTPNTPSKTNKVFISSSYLQNFITQYNSLLH